MAKKPFSPTWALYLAAAQVGLAVIIAAVTATQLDASNGDCYLNLIPGRVCDFVYSTVGFSLLFTLMVAVPTFLWQANAARANTVPLVAEAAHLSLFAAFWWFVMALTITLRGQQAGGAGLPGEGARGATIAFSWAQVLLFLGTAGVVAVDRLQQRAAKGKEDDDASSEPSSTDQYVYTQAHARLPIT